MKILGVNISHHMSYAFFEEGVLKEYYEEDRFNKIKNFNPFSDNLLTFEGVKKFKDIEFDCLASIALMLLLLNSGVPTLLLLS